ncbi:MAG: ATP-binding protein [Acidimicrobiales bacterium]
MGDEPLVTLDRLPVPLTSFIGRDAERAALIAALGRHREVTAVGPGGVGKTRLALAVAAEPGPQLRDGAWLVDLVPVTTPALVAQAVAAALGVSERQGQALDDALVAMLRVRKGLLVLDNCEHGLDGVGPLVEHLLGHCPGITVLATSRERLVAPFESVFRVPPLSLPRDDGDESGDGDDSDAVALFVDRAQVADPNFHPGADDLQAIAAICRQLDGIALAIELAAARAASLGLDELAAGLAAGLELLSGGTRAVERHRSVRATVEWSAALLSDAEPTLLRHVSVFAAPFAPAGATAVTTAARLGSAQVPETLARWLTRAWPSPIPIPMASATGCWRRSANTGSNCSTRPANSMRYGVDT